MEAQEGGWIDRTGIWGEGRGQLVLFWSLALAGVEATDINAKGGHPWEIIRAGLRPGAGYPEYTWGHNAFLRSQEKTGGFISPLHLEPQQCPQPP